MNLGFGNVDLLCSTININEERPNIDLSHITFFTPFALVYLGMFLRYHNAHGKVFAVIPPINTAARNYMARQNFWVRYNFNPATVKDESLRRLTGNTSLNDMVDIEKRENIAEEIANKVMHIMRSNSVRVNSALISELICELVDNFARHSDCNLAAIAMQYYPNLHRIQFAIGDCGIGIRASLSTNPHYAYLIDNPHYDAALKAFEPLVSRMPEGGTGLTEVRDEIVNLNGGLTLTTGNGYVIIAQGEMKYGLANCDLSGVQMGLSFPEVV